MGVMRARMGRRLMLMIYEWGSYLGWWKWGVTGKRACNSVFLDDFDEHSSGSAMAWLRVWGLGSGVG